MTRHSHSLARWHAVLAWVIGFVAIVLLFVLSPPGQARLLLDVHSTRAGTAQLFWPDGTNALSEARSTTRPVAAGANRLEHALPASTRWVRWDPVDGPAEVTVVAAQLQVLWVNIALHADALQAMHDVAAASGESGRLRLTLAEGASDPQLRIDLPWRWVRWAQWGQGAVVAAVLLALLAGLRRERTAWGAGGERAERLVLQCAEALRPLPGLVLVAFALWLFSLASFSISVDDELAAFRQDPAVWVAQGRWTVYLVERFLIPQPTLPFFPHALFCISLAISYLLLLRAYRHPLQPVGYLLFALFAAFPIWHFIGEFYANLPSAGLGLMASAAAALAFRRQVVEAADAVGGARRRVAGLLWPAACVALAMGAYQSMVFVFASIVLGMLAHLSWQGRELTARGLARVFAQLALIGVIAAVLYVTITRLSMALLALEPYYLGSFARLDLLLAQPWVVTSSVLAEALGVYLGSADVYGVALWSMGALAVLALLASPRGRTTTTLLLWCGALLSPFALHLVAGGAGTVPLRALLAVPFAVWLMALVATSARQPLLRALGLVVTVLAVLQFTYAAANYQAARHLALAHDRDLAAAIHQRIVAVAPGLDSTQPHLVDLHGARPYHSPYPRVESTTAGQSFFEWDGGNPYRMVMFMNLLGYGALQPVSDARRAELQPLYAQMPSWPAAGSVRRDGDVTLVKLGPRPGMAFGPYERPVAPAPR